MKTIIINNSKIIQNILIKCVAIGLLTYTTIGDHEYDFYTLLHWIIFGAVGFLSFDSFLNKKPRLTFIFAIIALMFNPFVKARFEIEMWEKIDLIVAVILGVFVVVDLLSLRNAKRQNENLLQR